MSTAPRRARRLFAGLVAALPALAAAQFVTDAYESKPLLRASDVVPERLLRSGAHLVRDEVAIDDNHLVFEIESEFGIYQVRSLAMLRIRVHEVETLAQAVNQYEHRDRRFAAELRGQLHVGADSFVDIVKSPLHTATELAGQLANNVGDTVSAIGDFSGEDAPQPAPDAAAGGPLLQAHKRSVASQLNLDVYSTNPTVQQFLDRLARARTAGRFTAGVVTLTVPPAAGRQVAGGAVDALVDDRVKEYPAAELDQLTAQQLAAMGVDEPLRTRFMENAAFSPRHRASIAAHLEFLDGVADRAALIEAALSAHSEAEAVSFEQLARMFALYHENVARLRSLRAEAGLPLGITAEDRLVVALPVDIVYWNEDAEQTFGGLVQLGEAAGYQGRELVLSGILTAAARQQLERRGFTWRETFLSPAQR